jgi:hypothetical protein
MGLPVLNTGKENKFRQAENPEDGKTSQQFAVRVSRPTSISYMQQEMLSLRHMRCRVKGGVRRLPD